jgi:hypothetical protein
VRFKQGLFQQRVGGDEALNLICTHVYAGSGPHPPAKREEGTVPWRDFVIGCLTAIGSWHPIKSHAPDSRWTSAMGNHLSTLNNAQIPSRYDRNLYTLAFYQRQVGYRTGFLDRIAEVHAELVKRFDQVATQETEPQ